MKKLSVFVLTLMVLSCNKTTLIEPVIALTCDDTSVFEYNNGLKYTFDKNNRIVKLEQKIKPVNNTYNLQYDKSLLTFTNRYVSANYEEAVTFQLNEKGSIKSFETKSDGTLRKGLYEYDEDNRLIKFSMNYSSINNPNLFQVNNLYYKWENDNIVTVSLYYKYGNEIERLQKTISFEYSNNEILDKDNFYNLVFFDLPNINPESFIGIDYLALNKGKSIKNIPSKFKVSSGTADVFIGGIGQYTYQFDKFNRLESVKISNGVTQDTFKKFNYLCH